MQKKQKPQKDPFEGVESLKELIEDPPESKPKKQADSDSQSAQPK